MKYARDFLSIFEILATFLTFLTLFATFDHFFPLDFAISELFLAFSIELGGKKWFKIPPPPKRTSRFNKGSKSIEKKNKKGKKEPKVSKEVQKWF